MPKFAAALADEPQVVTPSAGDTVTANGKPVLILNHSSLILTLTVALPASPRDGQKFTLGSRSAITTLTLTHAKTIYGTLTGMAALGFAQWVYSTAADAWVRVG